MKRQLLFLLISCTAVIGLFLAVSFLVAGRLGYPLDDAWIHQTYARSLAQHGRFEFVPGVTSSGSTAPFWTLLLTIGYLLRLPYLFWSYLLGAASLFWAAAATMQLWRQLWPHLASKDWLIAACLLTTWPLLWAASSGMETILFAAIGLQITAVYLQTGEHSNRQLALMGLLSGLLILTRPDGVVLLALLLAGLLLRPATPTLRAKRLAWVAVTAVLLLLPYFLFNQWANGTFWPNTMGAKQTEYTVLLQQPLLKRLAQLLYLSLGGPAEGWRGISSSHLLLLPGLIWASWLALQADWAKRQLRYTLPLGWAAGHVLLYAWKLPVTYQHGRYLLAIIPLWVLYGLAGWLLLLFNRQGGRPLWFGQKIAQLTFAAIALFFLFQGALAYATDVAIIEGEMVAMGQWLAENTPPQALVATHDIGAIGYFAQRPLLDLAGLITPEVIPLLADQAAISAYVLDSPADYLVTAPGWPYTAVVESGRATELYSTNLPLTQQAGLNNMTVYALTRP